MNLTTRMRIALTAATEDQIIFDLDGIEAQYDSLIRELPDISVRFAVKACPVDEVLDCLAQRGAGFDAASPQEIRQAARTGVAIERIHYGNTIKSDRNIADAYRLGVRDFATDSLEDVAALAEHAPGARVFCRLAATGDGALWGLSGKFGCSTHDAVQVLEAVRAAGLIPSGLSVHVGSQQMTAEAWQDSFGRLAAVLETLNRRGIFLGRINLGGGLPALGYLDKHGRRLEPPLDKMFAVIREGVQQLSRVSAVPLDFVMEPGRHLVADQGAIRTHVARLSSRRQIDDERRHWLYLSCGKFNGLYEMDELQYPLVFPTHTAPDVESVPAVVAGPTCDSDDAYSYEQNLVRVPAAAASGDPVWVLSCGAYATSYVTQGFNGFSPLPYTCIREGLKQMTADVHIRHISESDWVDIVALEADAYTESNLSEEPTALKSRARISPTTCFVLESERQIVGYVLALPYPLFSYPDLARSEEVVHHSRNLHLHDLVIAKPFRRRGLAKLLLHELTAMARSETHDQISLIAAGGSDTFWLMNGFRPRHDVKLPRSYGPQAVYMSKAVSGV